jgi:hypoxanthine phosphoribosyltransferase
MSPGVRTLIDRERIARRVAELGREITSDLERELAGGDAEVVLLCALTGALVFTADLIRHMPVKMAVRTVTVSSYPGAATTSQGVNIRGEIPTDLAGKHVLIVDDILDSGRTLGLLRRVIAAQQPATLRVAVLLRKTKVDGRDEDVRADYAGFDIADDFVVGYGLDYDGYFRNLPEVAVLTPSGSGVAGGPGDVARGAGSRGAGMKA